MPSILVAPAARDEVARAAADLAEVAQAIPAAALSLVLERAEFELLLRAPPSDRVRSLLLSGVVRPGLESEAPDTGVHGEGDARSSAEAFLHELLSAHPETRGLFELNGRVGITALDGATHSLEIDLVSRGLRLAIEIDGYHHFQDPAAYRRDRRKDLLMQRAGFHVVRVLAEDVVTRLEEILQTVVVLVRDRRAEEAAK